jgi:hypothetical protein
MKTHTAEDAEPNHFKEFSALPLGAEKGLLTLTPGVL